MSESALIRRAEGVLEARLSEDELVLLGPDSEVYVGLDRIAADIWGRLAEPKALDALAAELAEAYDAPAETIAADIAPVIAELIAEGLLARAAPGG